MLKCDKIMMIMEKSKKPSTIHVPLKLAFTENGSNYVLTNKKELNRLQLADSSDEQGIQVSQFSPSLLQHLIILDYISKIEVSIGYREENRSELIDLYRVVFFSKLYQQFNSAVLSRLLASDCITRHNRTNPSKCLDEAIAVDDSPFEAHVKNQTDIQQRILKIILNPIHETILRNSKYTPEERKTYMLMMEKYLNSMSYYNWYILILFSNDSGFPHMIASIRVLLTDFLPKSTIADYVPYVILEVCSNLETKIFEKETKEIYGEKNFNNSMLLDSMIRDRVYKSLFEKKELMHISWKVASSAVLAGKENSIKVTIFSKTSDFREIKESINNIKSFNIRKKTLIDLYKDLPKGHVGNDLGMYYISYLEDACKNVNIKLSVHVNQIISDEVTFVDLVFKF